jgi:leucyl aminopeptidase
MKFTLTSRPLSAQAKDALIVFVQDQKPLTGGDPDLDALIAQQIKKTGFDGDALQTAVFPTFGKTKADAVILSGLGKCAGFRMETLERAAAAAVRAGKKAGAKSFATAAAAGIDRVADAAFIRAAARGAAWGTYEFDTFKTRDAKKTPPFSLTFAGSFENAAAGRRALTDAQAESDALLSTADLANLPGNIATPQKIADWASRMAKETGLTCSVLGKAELKKNNCNALLAVAAGSKLDAKIITLKYKGTDPEAKPVVLVGKTITFDSGGISLKQGKGMGWMLYDKCGGMAVLTAMKMVALLKPKSPVIGILTVAENMPGGGATRPGDIIKSRSGKTIEILNTDAEGRLALCDALNMALTHKPAAVVDLATLTGAVIVALGHNGSAVMGNNPNLTRALINAGEAGGERLWELPIWDEHKEDIKGTFADLQNIGKSGTAGTITAGAFLSEFVPDDIPWAHIDIAGTAWVETPKPWMAPGATLFGARTLIEWIKGME